MNRIKLPPAAEKLLVVALGFGVAFVVTLAPLTGARRIPHFQPLADVLLERHKILLMPVAGILLSAIGLIVHFYYGEELSLKHLRRSFFVTLAVFLVSVGALLMLPWYVIKPGCLEQPTIVGWSRLPGCDCKERVPDDAACYVQNGCSSAGCWSKGQVRAVELSMYASYLGSLCGFLAMAGIVVLIERARAQERLRKKPVKPARPAKRPPKAPRPQRPAT